MAETDVDKSEREAVLVCNCATFGNAHLCPFHTQADFDAAERERLADPDEVRRLREALGNGQAAVDWFESELEAVRQERNAADARVRELEDALREVYAHLEKPAVIIGAASMPIRYENARKAALRALSDD